MCFIKSATNTKNYSQIRRVVGALNSDFWKCVIFKKKSIKKLYNSATMNSGGIATGYSKRFVSFSAHFSGVIMLSVVPNKVSYRHREGGVM